LSSETQRNQPIELFYSYSHKDEELREQLEKHLRILKRNGIIADWYSRKIKPGEEWEPQIYEHLNSAHIILLLISPDFIDSDYCYDVEVRRAMERHENEEAIVIPVILRPVRWKGSSFSKLQALPKKGKPVTSWKNQDKAFANVVEGIVKVVDQFKLAQDKLQKSVRDPEKRAKVIVIEDNKRWRDRIVELLEKANCEVEDYEDITEELHIRLWNKDYDLLIIDLRLDESKEQNEKEGRDLIAKVRKSRDNDDIPIIVISGIADVSDVRDAFTEYKVHDFMNKAKWDNADFLIAVNRALKERKNG
jgi:CheY-like chemotaxis protein